MAVLHGNVFITMEDILFNRLNILKVNFFETNGDISTSIARSISTWYVNIRNIAIIISLVVLIYIGIRMALSTLAEDRAKYKKMLTDWVVGFILIFLLHYIIVITLYTNDSLVSIFSANPSTNSDYAGTLASEAINNVSATKGFGYAAAYICLNVLIFMFLFNYIKRMLTVAFLVVIAPIITVTYSIDRIGDRKITSIKYMVKRIYI